MIEEKLAEVADGKVVDWGGGTLPAASIETMLRKHGETGLSNSIIFRNAVIAGDLELALVGQAAPLSVEFQSCRFCGRFRGRGSRWRHLLLIHCQGSSIEMAGIEVEANLVVAESRFSGNTELRDARIGGNLSLARSHFSDGQRQPAVALSGASIGRDLDMMEAEISGAMIAERLSVAGDAKFDGAAFHRTDDEVERSLVLTDATVAGRLRLVANSQARPFVADARVDLVSAHVGDVLAKGAQFLATDGPALVADQIVVDKTIDLSGGAPDGSQPFDARSDVRFLAARVGGQIQVYDARFASQDRALLLAGARVAGDVVLGSVEHDVILDGGLDLTATAISGQLSMLRLIANARPEQDFAISVRHARLGGPLGIYALRARGAVQLDTLEADGIDFQDTLITRVAPRADLAGLPEAYSHPQNTLLDLHHARTRTDVHIEQLRLEGGDFRMLGADIGGGIQMSRIDIEGAEGRAFIGQEMRVGGGFYISGTPDQQSRIVGEINLLNAKIDGSVTFVRVDVGSVDQPATVQLRRAQIQGDVALHGTNLHGELSVSAATIKGDLRTESCVLKGHDKVVYNAISADVGGAIEWTRARGIPCEIDGFLDLDGASAGVLRWNGLELADGAKLRLTNMRVARVVEAKALIARGRAWLDLTGTETPALVDTLAEDQDGWGAGKVYLALDGFAYARLNKPSGRAEDDPRTIRRWRRIWFARRADQRSSRPIRHLSLVLKRQGLYEASRRILMDAFSTESWSRSPYGARQLSLYFGLFYGHGLSGWRALTTLLILWATGTFGVVSLQNRGLLIETETKNGAGPVACVSQIDPGLYAADVMLPVVELGEEKKCEIGLAPNAPAQQALVERDGYAIGTPLDIARLGSAIYALISWLCVSLALATWSGLFKRAGRDES